MNLEFFHSVGKILLHTQNIFKIMFKTTDIKLNVSLGNKKRSQIYCNL
jgi:hypothetical protein